MTDTPKDETSGPTFHDAESFRRAGHRLVDQIADFYVEYGADKEKFLSTAQSFAVDGKIRKDQQLVRSYGITGTPSLVVAGKYRVAGSQAVPTFDVLLDVVDYLVEIEKAGLKDASVAAE